MHHATPHPPSPPRVSITTFFHQGEGMDYTGRGYSVNHLGVYKHGKTLGANSSRVDLSCANGSVKKFGKLRLYHAVLNPLPSPEIEIASGFRAVDYDYPAPDPRRYAYETAADRQTLIETNARALPDEWKPLVYTNKSTKFSQMYEIHGITGHIRRISKKSSNPNKILNLTSDGRVGLCGTGGSGGSNRTMIFSHIAYMWTFKSEEREWRSDQTQVDHINGDHADNSPHNLRWASPTENCLYKFKQRTKPFDGHPAPETMDLSKLTQFLDTDILCGNARLDRADSKSIYVIYNKQTNKYRSTGDFLVDARHRYPMITINGITYYVHCLVAFMSGIISYDELESMGTNELVVMHKNDNKQDFNPTNLKRGTSSENQLARQDNPDTTLRKRVRAIETLESGEECVAEYESRTAAARAVNGKHQRISEAIGRNSIYMGMRWECAV